MMDEVKEKRFKIISIIINFAVVIMEAAAFSISFKYYDVSAFQFYTEDSNLLALIACLIMAVCQIKSLRNPEYKIPVWVKTLKYMSVCCLSVTFLVVLFVLAPVMGGVEGFVFMFLSYSMLYTHFLCPVFAFISFVFFEKQPILKSRAVYISIIPTIVYAVITVSLNAAKLMSGPYPFLKVYEQPAFMTIVWAVVILGGAYLISFLLWKINKYKSAPKEIVKNC